ncbi:HD domain-containing protein [Methanolacinia paynteri]|uniref:HD domain-containing protein n=1 Tax=Methanolacinia paynteri TaxID=230356 RepID=UPI00064F0003|nr:HD domain-containing protein [Methanolacinia paynteri]
MKTIKDPVHGYISVNEKILPLLDSPQVQRLRHIRQLGFSDMVYPGANHTRFEHSLGTMHLAGILAKRLKLDDNDVLLSMVSGILHDIGHGPFSHATEPLIEEYIGRSHHEVEHMLRETEISGAVEKIGLDPSEICRMIEGKHKLAGIIHGDLDVDRMDYLMRDAHYTGVPYGTVDAQRLIQSTILSENGLALKDTGIIAAESLLIARTLMRPTIYFHHVSRIAESMVKAAAVRHLEVTGSDRANELLSMDDGSFSVELMNSESESASTLMKSLMRRSLYKRSIYVGLDQIRMSSVLRSSDSIDERKIATEIAETAGVNEDFVLVDIPSFPSPMSIDVMVENRNDLVSLEEMSPLLNTLNDTRRIQWRMGVYTLPEYRRAVESAATEILNISKPTKQNKLNI